MLHDAGASMGAGVGTLAVDCSFGYGQCLKFPSRRQVPRSVPTGQQAALRGP
jgi:hypothetical protein